MSLPVDSDHPSSHCSLDDFTSLDGLHVRPSLAGIKCETTFSEEIFFNKDRFECSIDSQALLAKQIPIFLVLYVTQFFADDGDVTWDLQASLEEMPDLISGQEKLAEYLLVINVVIISDRIGNDFSILRGCISTIGT